jgi:hypothetical protein
MRILSAMALVSVISFGAATQSFASVSPQLNLVSPTRSVVASAKATNDYVVAKLHMKKKSKKHKKA